MSLDKAISASVNNEYIKMFLLSGNCQCTIENIKTGNSFKYKIRQNKNKSDMFFVNVITGIGDIYAGYFYVHQNLIDYRKGEKGNLTEEDVRIQALLYVLNNYTHLPPYVLVEHTGYCACCGKILNADEQKSGLCEVCISNIKL